MCQSFFIFCNSLTSYLSSKDARHGTLQVKTITLVLPQKGKNLYVTLCLTIFFLHPFTENVLSHIVIYNVFPYGVRVVQGAATG
jgi:hypothetical protein